MEGGIVLGGNNEPAGLFGGFALDNVGYLSAEVGRGDDGTSAGEHASEFGGHDEVGCSGALGEKMDIGCVEEIVEAVERLEREHRYVGTVGDQGFELWAKGSVAAEEEVNSGVMREEFG